MAIVDYGALVWKNGKPFGKRENLFEETINTLGFKIDSFIYTTINDNVEYNYNYSDGNDYVYIGNKNIIFSFYKGEITVCNYKEKEIKFITCYSDYNKYKKDIYEVFGQKFTVKPLKPNSVFLFNSIIDGDKYEVLFGYGIDPKWYKYYIPERYNYNTKMIKFLNSHDGKNYHLK